MSRHPLTVRVRLTLWYTGALVVIMAIVSVSIYTTTRLTLDRHVDQQLDDLGAVFETVLRHNPDELLDPHELSEIEKFGVIPLFHIAAGDTVVYQSAAWRRIGLGEASGHEDPGETSPVTGADGIPYFAKSSLVDIGGRSIQISTAVDGGSTLDALHSVRIALLVALPCSLLLAVLGGNFLAGKMLAPLGKMAATAQEITAEQLSQRLPVENPDDELGKLAVAFNHSLGRIEGSFRQLRQFTADASHELRTPLTALRSVGEVGLQEADDPERLREVIGSMLEDADRLTQLVETLLTLTRADFGDLKVRRSAGDLGELSRSVSEDLAVLAEEKSLQLRVDSTDALTVDVDPSIFRLALINILDNAIKYSPEQGTIQVSVGRNNDDQAFVSVQDDGPGIPSSHRETVFDRFVRVDEGRTRSIRGVGLGLSIARWATEIHGGHIDLETDEGLGSLFRIVLPLSSSR